MSTIGRIFSGIQPSGVPHLGNYFGAISQWIRIATTKQVVIGKSCVEQCDKPIFCVVDVHAYTSGTYKTLCDNTYSTLASLLATGLSLSNCVIYLQSDVLEHFYLDNVLDNFIGSQRLKHMTQFKEKSRKRSKNSITNALLNYPMLQAADILLYKAKYVPIGSDQTQHIELTRDIADKFNSFAKYDFFHAPIPIYNEIDCRRLKSLRNPDKKMSKSDANQRAFIEIVDSPDNIVDKCKKAVTDCISEINFNPIQRPGVSNLITIFHLVTGLSIDQVVMESSHLNTGQFKLKLADAIIEKFAPVRKEYLRLQNDRSYLDEVFRKGKELAQPIAVQTIHEVKLLLGHSATKC